MAIKYPDTAALPVVLSAYWGYRTRRLREHSWNHGHEWLISCDYVFIDAIKRRQGWLTGKPEEDEPK